MERHKALKEVGDGAAAIERLARKCAMEWVKGGLKREPRERALEIACAADEAMQAALDLQRKAEEAAEQAEEWQDSDGLLPDEDWDALERMLGRPSTQAECTVFDIAFRAAFRTERP